MYGKQQDTQFDDSKTGSELCLVHCKCGQVDLDLNTNKSILIIFL